MSAVANSTRVSTDEEIRGSAPEWDYFPVTAVALWSDGHVEEIYFYAHKFCTDEQLVESAWVHLRDEYEVDDSTSVIRAEWVEGGQ